MVADLDSAAYSDKWNERNRGNDRVIALKKMEGKPPLNSIGMIDKRLFEGTNKLHCILDPETSMWSFKMEQGLIPGALDQNFTSFSKAKAHAKEYYEKRNVTIE